MCLSTRAACGAYDAMGKPGANLVYEDVRQAADANGVSVDQTLETIT